MWRIPLLTIVLALVFALQSGGAVNAANFTVTREDDPPPDGCAPSDCSLREAIIDANGSSGSTVTIPDLLDDPPAADIFDIGAELVVSKDTTITGAGSDTTILDGGTTNRIFHIASGTVGTVKIEDLTVRNGVGDWGGGLWNAGATLNVTNAVFEDNTAQSLTAGNGGGIDNVGTLTVTNSVFRGNKAAPFGGLYFGYGGGISNGGGTLTVNGGSLFEDNYAAEGSGIMSDGGILTIRDSTFLDNFSATAGGTGIHAQASVTEIDKTIVEDTNDDSYVGIWIEGSGGPAGPYTVSNSTITGYNTGILVRYEAQPTITNSVVSGNAVGLTTIGTAAPSVDGTLFDGNGTGILAVGSSQLDVDNSVISGNTVGLKTEVTATPTVDGTFFDGNGTGILAVGSSQPTVTNSLISGNTVVGLKTEDTAAPTVDGTFFDGNVIGILAVDASQPDVSDSVFSGNTVAGVKTENTAAPAVDRAFFEDNGTGVLAVGASQPTVSNSSLSGNTVGLETQSTATLTVHGTFVSNNTTNCTGSGISSTGENAEYPDPGPCPFSHIDDLTGRDPDDDTDGDGVMDAAEVFCGADYNDLDSVPEQIDGPWYEVDDDGDTEEDEILPARGAVHDCDGDGFTGVFEDHVYATPTPGPSETPGPPTRGDQDRCGATAPGWPLDIVGGNNKVNVFDMIPYIGNLGSTPGNPGWDQRLDLDFDWVLSIADTNLQTTLPIPMLDGATAQNQTCPDAP